MDHSSTNQFNHYNEIYPKKYQMSNSDLLEYEPTRYDLTTNAVSMAYAALNECIENLINAMKRRCNKDFEDMESLNKPLGELYIDIIESFEQINTSLSDESKGLNDSEPTISQTEQSVPLQSIHLSIWTIVHEKDKKEIKKGEQCDHLSETHLKMKNR